MDSEPLAETTSAEQRPNLALRYLWAGLMLLALVLAYPNTALAQSDHGCATSGAVPDPATNTALVADCETLLGLKDTLRGSAPLDWDVETPIWQWEGVAVASVDGIERVVALSLWERQLNGIIPDTLGNLSRLEHLWLYGNRLTGEIPATLGSPLRAWKRLTCTATSLAEPFPLHSAVCPTSANCICTTIN